MPGSFSPISTRMESSAPWRSRARTRAIRTALAGLLLALGCRGETPSEPEGNRAAQIEAMAAGGEWSRALAEAEAWEAVSREAACEARAQTARMATRLALPAGRARRGAVADSLAPVVAAAIRDYRYADALAAVSLRLRAAAGAFGERSAETSRVRLELAEIYHLLGEYDRARLLAGAASADLGDPRGIDAPLAALVHRRLGILDKDLRRYADADSEFVRGLRILDGCGCGEGPTRIALLEAEASLRRREGRHRDAESLYRRAWADARSFYGEDSEEGAEIALWFAYALFAAEHYEEAELIAVGARRTLLASTRRPDAVARAAANLLQDLAGLRGDKAGVEAMAREGLAYSTRSWASVPGGFALSRESSNEVQALAAIALERGDTLGAWPFVDASYGGMSRVVASRARTAATAGTGARLDSLADRGGRGAARLLAAGDADPLAWASLASIDGERCRMETDLAAGLNGADSLPSLADLQSALSPGEAMIGWFRSSWGSPHGDRTRIRLWGYVVRRQGPPHWVSLGSWTGATAERRFLAPLMRLDEAFNRASGWGERVARDPDVDRWASEAGARLFDPLRPYLDGARTLIVCTGPFSIYPPLECWKTAGGDDLLEDYAIAYSPSPSVLPILRSGSPALSIAASPALLIADPRTANGAPAIPADPLASLLTDQNPLPGATTLDTATLRSALAGDPHTLRSLPPLPYASYEVTRIAAVLSGSTVLLGKKADEPELEAMAEDGRLGRFAVVHVAAHALADPDRPYRVALALAPGGDGESGSGGPENDGLVTAEDMLCGWRVRASLITLSGCQTGGEAGVVRTGEPAGFLQALLRAGAESVLLSRWKVDDLGTALLMERFYRDLVGTGGSGDAEAPASTKAEALREAELWLRGLTDARGRHPFAHPVYWSGFVLFGDPD
jgi:CHAT domain-containing protein/tetratricopeptide (TPR) repeat protein